MSATVSAERLNKIRFRAWRRGFREADLILGPFADRFVGAMDETELDAFEALLAEQDHDLYGWISGQPAPAEIEGPMLERLRDFQRNLPIASGDVTGL
jgi:antitoxin CptB